MINKRLLALLICLFFSPLLHSQAIQQFESVPGGVAVVPINTNNKPDAYFKDERVMVLGKPDKWQAVIGIGLNITPGTHRLEVHDGGAISTHNFEVGQKQYEEQRITIKNERQVNPNPVDMERIKKERTLIANAKLAWTEQDELILGFQKPVEGITSSPFGLRRFFNDQPRNPHSGLDIAAPEGTPIKAAMSGRVVNTGDYFFNGNTVFIEHGQGLITMYCHMSKISVTTDQIVETGEYIGEVGMTGRVTGPHLHWSVYLNKSAIDPLQLLEDDNTQ